MGRCGETGPKSGMKNIIIIGPGRCGSHWIGNICQRLFGHKSAEGEELAVPGKEQVTLDYYAENVDGGKIIVTHFPLSSVRDFLPYALVIAALRDPRDMIVSAVHYRVQKDGRSYPETLEESIRQGHQFYWTEDYLQHRQSVPHIDLRYEDLHRDGIKSMKRVSDGLGMTISEKRTEEVFRSLDMTTLHSQDPIMYRRGKFGTWPEYLSEDQAAIIMDRYKEFVSTVYPEGV